MRPNSQRGQVYPLFGIMLVSLIGISSLSVDMGYYRYQQRVQQAATDSAAIAGAQASFYDSTNSANPVNAGLADAKQNGFNNGSGGVVVSIVPLTDSGNCSGGCYQARITKSYPVFFGSIFRGFSNNKGQRKILTTAAAKLQAVAGACLTSLGPTTTTSTLDGTGGGINGQECGIANADCTVVTGGSKDDVASLSYNSAAGSCNSCKITACVSGGVPIDPCSVTPQCQTLANATAADLGLNSLTTPTCKINLTLTVTKSPFTPGCYGGSPSMSGTLNQGLYVFTGTPSFAAGTTGTNVTLYFAKGASWSTGSAKNQVISFSAPSIGSGDYLPGSYAAGEEGIVMYQAPGTNWSMSTNQDLSLTGLAYQPNLALKDNGHGLAVDGNFTTYSFNMKGSGKGNGGIDLTPGNGTTAAGPQIPTLVE